MNLGKAVLMALIILIAGCKKTENTTATYFVAGKGGIATIKATPLHGVVLVDSCTIYIKYNMALKPENGVYDDSAKCIQEAGKPVATFTQLKKGNYYLYGKGWDGQEVAGGTSWMITDTITANAITIPVDN